MVVFIQIWSLKWVSGRLVHFESTSVTRRKQDQGRWLAMLARNRICLNQVGEIMFGCPAVLRRSVVVLARELVRISLCIYNGHRRPANNAVRLLEL